MVDKGAGKTHLDINSQQTSSGALGSANNLAMQDNSRRLKYVMHTKSQESDNPCEDLQDQNYEHQAQGDEAPDDVLEIDLDQEPVMQHDPYLGTGMTNLNRTAGLSVRDNLSPNEFLFAKPVP